IAEYPRRIPRPIGPLGDVVAEVGVTAGDGAPVAGRVPPGVDARERGFEDILASNPTAPRFGDDFGGAAEAHLHSAPQHSRSADEVGMMLPLHIRLALAMIARVIEERRMAGAENALRYFRMHTHSVNHAAL